MVDLRLLKLGDCDIVLGVDWVRQYNPIVFDFKELKLSFARESKLSCMGPLELLLP